MPEAARYRQRSAQPERVLRPAGWSDRQRPGRHPVRGMVGQCRSAQGRAVAYGPAGRAPARFSGISAARFSGSQRRT